MKPKTIIFYDASCPLCKSEIEMVKLHDHNQSFNYIDCSSPDFDDSFYQNLGYTQQLMMEQLHIKDIQGEWFVGVDAFQLIYKTIGMQKLAYLWGGKLTRPLTKKVYPWIAKNRHFLSFIGFPILFQFITRHAAKNANKESRKCKNNQCIYKGEIK